MPSRNRDDSCAMESDNRSCSCCNRARSLRVGSWSIRSPPAHLLTLPDEFACCRSSSCPMSSSGRVSWSRAGRPELAL